MPTTDPVKRKVIVSSYQKRNAWRLNRERLLKKLLGKASDATGGKDGKVALYRGTWNWNVWKQSLGMSPMPYTPRLEGLLRFWKACCVSVYHTR